MRPYLIKIRKANHLTQKELGEMVGLSKQAICNLERGRSAGKVGTWDKLAAVLDVDTKQLRQELDSAKSDSDK